MKLCILVGSSVVSLLFWWLADLLGCEFFTSFMISGVGALVGCWAGWVVARRYFF